MARSAKNRGWGKRGFGHTAKPRRDKFESYVRRSRYNARFNAQHYEEERPDPEWGLNGHTLRRKDLRMECQGRTLYWRGLWKLKGTEWVKVLEATP